MILSIHPQNPDERKINQIVEILRQGGIIIYPTDTVYGLGCSIMHAEAIGKICRLKKIKPDKAQLSFICNDLSHLSNYTKSIDNPTFRILKKNTPGPYTFILPASKIVPKLLYTKKDTVGIRVPDNKICKALIKQLGHPLVSTSIPLDDEEIYLNDPEIIYSRFCNQVDAIIDAGIGNITTSTVVDCTIYPPVILRQGAGIFDEN